MKSLKLIVPIVAALVASGCVNMPTQSSQITGAYISPLKYEHLNCHQLKAEADSLSRRESQLTLAQEQRMKSSKVQAFWLGYGQGDGIEASELANVRGEKEAVARQISYKRCY